MMGRQQPFDVALPVRFNPSGYWMFEREVVSRKEPNKGKVCRIGNGWPSPMRRWCTRQKVSAIDAYVAKGAIRYIGFAADEDHRCDSISNVKKGVQCLYPLIDWGMTEDHCLSYCQSKGFDFGGLYVSVSSATP